MLFHLGALRRLDEVGLLDVAARISSVSGGSITAAALAAESSRHDDAAPSTRTLDAVADRLHHLASHTIDIPSVLAGVVLRGSAATHLAGHYRRVLGDLSLQDLPDRPRFTFNTTNFVTGALVRWSKEYAADASAAGRRSRSSTRCRRRAGGSAQSLTHLRTVEDRGCRCRRRRSDRFLR